MCGFTGILGDLTKRELDKSIYKMTDSLNHRGPDDGGTWIGGAGKIALGHRRLSIIDLSLAGHQPMVSLCGRYIIALNGEIYNHLELRIKLFKGKSESHSWRGHSDTETLLAAISQWGVDRTLNHAIGMFAFSLWDCKHKKLTLARDRFGEKPLYYGWSNNAFIFGSELKALKEYQGFNKKISREALSLYMRHMYIPAPFSIFQNIYKLEPGCLLQIDSNELNTVPNGTPFAPFNSKTFSIRKWYSLRDAAEKGINNRINDKKEAIEAIDKVLSESVRSQMISDVPLGAFLSGGVDSSIIVSLMQKYNMNPVNTFTIGFSEDDFNEAKYAKAVAKHIGTEHHEFYVNSNHLMSVIPNIANIYDEPFADSSQIPTYLVSCEAKKNVSVVLSGDGGDELFGGYNRYLWSRNIWNRVSWMPKPLRKIFSHFITAIPIEAWNKAGGISSYLPYIKKDISLLGDKAYKLASRLSSINSLDDLYMSLVSEWQSPSKIVLNANEPDTLLRREMRLPILEEHESRMMYWDSISYLPDDILCKVDRASMSVGLETRVPMLDYRVAELSHRLPLNFKIHNGEGKWALRQVLDKYVPRDLIERPKAGFGIPVGSWIRGPLKDWSEDLLSEHRLQSDGYFDTDSIRVRWKEHVSGKRDWTHSLWSVLMFNIWIDSLDL